MRPDGPRPKIIGPDSGPEPPFPLRMKGKVVSGFGRGSKEVRTLSMRKIRSTVVIAKADQSHFSSASQLPTCPSKAYHGSKALNQASTLAGLASNSPPRTRHTPPYVQITMRSQSVTSRQSSLRRSGRQAGDCFRL